MKFFLGRGGRLHPGGAGARRVHTAGGHTGAQALGPPTIALLGGFSASAVYRILTRMVEALESIFSGGAREQVLCGGKGGRHPRGRGEPAGAYGGGRAAGADPAAPGAGASPDEAAAQLRDVVAGLIPAGARPAPRDAALAAAPAEKVPALVVVSAPEEVVASADTDDSGG